MKTLTIDIKMKKKQDKKSKNKIQRARVDGYTRPYLSICIKF